MIGTSYYCTTLIISILYGPIPKSIRFILVFDSFFKKFSPDIFSLCLLFLSLLLPGVAGVAGVAGIQIGLSLMCSRVFRTKLAGVSCEVPRFSQLFLVGFVLISDEVVSVQLDE